MRQYSKNRANHRDDHIVCNLSPVIWSGGSVSTSVLRMAKFHGYSHPTAVVSPVQINSQMRASLFSRPYAVSLCLVIVRNTTLLVLFDTTAYGQFISCKCSWPTGTTVRNAPISQYVLHSNSPLNAISHHRPPSSKVLPRLTSSLFA